LLKWRKGTDDEKAGTTDFSATLTEAAGFVNMEDRFEGLFMPFSGYDADEGIGDVTWTADISKDDDVCKYDPALEIDEQREFGAAQSEFEVRLLPDDAFTVREVTVTFERPGYPELEVANESTAADDDEADDGKVTLKESDLGKELSLEFNVAAAADGAEGSQGADGQPNSTAALITSDHAEQIDGFFKDLFSAGKETLATGEDSNRYKIEIHGSTDPGARGVRLAAVAAAVSDSYGRTYEHDRHDFTSEIGEAHEQQIQQFVDELLADKETIVSVEAKLVVRLAAPGDSGYGEDDSFKAVKDKLQELFDAGKSEFVYHPGLDDKDEARTGALPLADVTTPSTVHEWQYQLPALLPDGTVGPGAFMGEEKTRHACPVKIEFSVQPHEEAMGEVEGNQVAWSCDPALAGEHLVRLILRAFVQKEDTARLDHGHAGQGEDGAEGMPGDCLEDGGSLCDDCVACGRSADLSVI